jgi:hypothetical protein
MGKGITEAKSYPRRKFCRETVSNPGPGDSVIKKKKNQLAYIDHVLIISNPEKDLSIVYAGL